MAITITNRLYLGPPYGGVPNMDWLIRNTGDWYRFSFLANVVFDYIVSQTQSITMSIDNTIKLDNGENWQNFGFQVGDIINFDVNGTSDEGGTMVSWVYSLTGREIVSINGSEIRVNGSDITIAPIVNTGIDTTGSFTRIPYQDGKNRTQNSARIWVDKAPKSLSFKYGLVTNSNNSTNSSIIDGNSAEFIINNLDTAVSGSVYPMTSVGFQSGLGIDNVTIIKDEGVEFGNSYLIQFDSFVCSIYEDMTNLYNFTAPDWLLGSESITDFLEVKAYPRYNNPNLFIKSFATTQLGNVGWFNENFNGLPNDFTVKSVEYFDSNNQPMQSLSFANDTKVKAVISGVDNLLNGVSAFTLGFAWCPEDTSFYKNKNTPFHKNLLVNTAGATNSGIFYLSNSFSPIIYNGFTNTPNLQMNVKNVRFSQNGNDVIYEAIFEPTSEFKNFIESLPDLERNYCLWVSVGDRLKILENSNRVSLLLDFNKLQLYIPPAGEWQPMTIDFYEHPNNGTENLLNNCGTDFIVEDDLLARVDFSVFRNSEVPQSIEFAIQAKNFTNDNFYTLDSYIINLQSSPIVNGFPIYNFEASRGFKYRAGNNKNLIKIERNPTNDTLNSYGYTAYYGFKIRWEDWLQRGGVPSDFYDPNELNNGFNNDWYQYQIPSWKIEFAVKTIVNNGQSLVEYINTKDMPIRDYLQNPNIQSFWYFYRNSDNYLLNAGTDPVTGRPLGIVLEEDETRLEVLFVRQSGTWSNLNNVYATIGLEVENGAGQMDFRQISSIWQSENDNPLKPLQGETLLKLTLVNPTTVKAECLINPIYLPTAPRLKHSARIGCKLS